MDPLKYIVFENPYILSSEVSFDKAKKNGWDVRLPEPNELFLDIDTKEDLEYFQKMASYLNEMYHFTAVATPSKSGGDKKHIVVKLNKNISDTERVLLQACLGSDRKACMISFHRILVGDSYPVLFFEAKK